MFSVMLDDYEYGNVLVFMAIDYEYGKVLVFMAIVGRKLARVYVCDRRSAHYMWDHDFKMGTALLHLLSTQRQALYGVLFRIHEQYPPLGVKITNPPKRIVCSYEISVQAGHENTLFNLLVFNDF